MALNRFSKPKHIYTQILTTQFFILLLTITLFISILGTLTLHALIKQTSNFNGDNLHYINNETDGFFKSIQQELDYIVSNQDIRTALVFSNQFQSMDNFPINAHTQNFLNYYHVKDYTLYLSNLYDTIPLSITKKSDASLLFPSDWIASLKDEQGDVILYANKDDENAWHNSSIQSIQYILPINNYLGDQPVGFLTCDIPYIEITRLFNEKIRPSYPIFILDEQNHLIYHTEDMSPDLIQDIMHEMGEDSNELRLNRDKTRYLVSAWTSDYTNWRIFSMVSLSKQLEPFYKAGLIFIPFIILIILLHTLISKNTSIKIIEPINTLIATMEHTSTGYLGEKDLKDTDIYEIQKLSQTYSDMMRTINDLINKNQKDNLLRVESQLLALQQKINPHFLFNTLELISGQAIIENAPASSEMAQKLGNLFRYNLRAPDLLTLREEMSYFTDYLYLQQIRYYHTLQVDMDVSEDLMEVMLPKLTLQPLVENSIKHGFDDLPSDENKIWIRGYEKEGNVYIHIRDNGKGISVEKLEELNLAMSEDLDHFHKFIDRRQHIGIRNVYARLCLFANEESHMLITSEENCYTDIEIRLPYRKEMRVHDQAINS